MLLPLRTNDRILLPLVNLPYSITRLPLHGRTTGLRAIQSVNLIRSNALCYSDVFNCHGIPIISVLTRLPTPRPLLHLAVSHTLVGNDPILVR